MPSPSSPPLESSWHQDWFDQDYLRLYSHRDPAEARHFLDLLEEAHGFRADGDPAPRVLDLACGSGRHTRELARRGFRVLGLDWSRVLLDEALRQGGTALYLRGDMHHPPLAPVFDWVLSLFTSFGYNREDERNASLLQAMTGLPRPGGRLLIDYLNPAWLREHLVPESTRQVGDWEVREEREIDKADNMVRKVIRFGPKGAEARVIHEAVKLYDPEWFVSRARRLGCSLEAHLGDLDGAPYRGDSPRSILLFRRAS